MRLPEKDYYSLKKVADQWKCSIEDLLYFGETGRLKMCVVLPPTHVKRLNMQKLEKNVESLELSLKGKCLPVKPLLEALSVLNPLMENAMESFFISSGIYLLSRKSIIDIRRGEGIMPVKSLNNDMLYYFCDEKPSQHNILGLSKRKFEITDLVITHEEKMRFEAIYGLARSNDIGEKERSTWLKIIYLLMHELADHKPVLVKTDGLNISQLETILKKTAKKHDLSDKGLSNSTLSKIYNEAMTELMPSTPQK